MIKKQKIKKSIFYSILFILYFLLFNCNNTRPDEKLQTDSNQAWVYERGSQKIAFTLNSSRYKNYIFDYELGVEGSIDVGFHTDRNILYFHADWYDEDGNYLGVWGDSLYIAENPGAPVNLYEFKIRGNRLTLTKPLYSYINPSQGKPFGDVSYVFTKKSFTPPNSLASNKMDIMKGNNIVGNALVRSVESIVPIDNVGNAFIRSVESIVPIDIKAENPLVHSNKVISPIIQQHPLSISFTYEIKDNQELSAFIYDIRGQRIKNISFKDDHLIWDFKDYDGNPVPAGLYFFLIMSDDEYIWKDVVFLM